MRTINLTFVLCLLLVSACTGNSAQQLQTHAAEPAVDEVVRRVWADENIWAFAGRDGRHLVFTDFARNAVMMRDLVTGETRQVTAPRDPNLGYLSYGRPSPDASHITYLAEQLDGTHLMVMRSDGSAEKVLLPAADQADWPEPADWTRDGRFILATLNSQRNGNELLLLAADGSSRRVLKSFGWRWPSWPSFSPDDQYVGYAREVRPDDPAEQVHVLNMTTGQENAIGPAEPGIDFLGWSIDGSSVLLSRTRGGLNSIYRVAVRNGRQAGEPTLVRNGGWSVVPAGSTSRGAMFGSNNQRSTIHWAAVDVAGGILHEPIREIAVEPNSYLGHQHGWSPDGEYLAYARNRNTTPKVAIIVKSLRSGEQREFILQPPIANVYAPILWSADGKALEFTARTRTDARRYRLRLDAGTVEELDSAADGELRVSADGQHRFLGERKSQNARIVTEHVASGARQVVYEGNLVSLLAYSPDENYVSAWEQAPDGSRHLLVIGLRGADAGKVRRYQPPGGNLLIPTWSPDGRYLLIGAPVDSTSRQRWGVWRIDLASSAVTMLANSARDGYIIPQLSADGQQIVLTGRPAVMHSEIWLIDEQAASRRAAAK